ncbi:ribosomal protein S18-alanine N-acetyltransferase [Thermovibrio ammonificans]|uniref:[Ribosomal protein bS18]-alanine N-acetyltransferase n=1 Tax=Thermovibrio ammonificans (strain DSM 15698 / JCM 12110 / HB-1) TaxID=648996 RepID=E8T5N3_THEA1|nr:ribosomal protein S18-alanine N-acetyltransferase [Thermovibrio ammonificans]ADU96508.1 ribosomal-protein-alanine acetyltransferase [Thermovibrio ammonificans HB-1]
MQNLRLEAFKEHHLSDILKIERELFKEPYTEELLRRELTLPVGFNVVALHQGEVIGYLMAWITGPTCELNRIAVIPRYRKQGVARKLINRLLEECRARKVEEVFLEVRKSNTPAINLYKKMGFKQISVRKNYYGDEDALILKLTL